MRVRWLGPVVLLLVSGVTTGCGASGDGWYGAITTLHPRLCVGRHEASGDCFEGASPSTMSSLRLGECVRVTFRSSATPGESHDRLLTIKPVKASDHQTDCPTSRSAANAHSAAYPLWPGLAGDGGFSSAGKTGRAGRAARSSRREHPHLPLTVLLPTSERVSRRYGGARARRHP